MRGNIIYSPENKQLLWVIWNKKNFRSIYYEHLNILMDYCDKTQSTNWHFWLWAAEEREREESRKERQLGHKERGFKCTSASTLINEGNKRRLGGTSEKKTSPFCDIPRPSLFLNPLWQALKKGWSQFECISLSFLRRDGGENKYIKYEHAI